MPAHDAAAAPPGNTADTGQALSAYSVHLLGEINAYRVQHGEHELTRSATLDELARGHSEDMASVRKLSHDGFRERIMRSGSSACVENVGWNYPTPERQRQGWSASPPHEKNMLDARITRAGVGDVDGYVTFIACR